MLAGHVRTFQDYFSGFVQTFDQTCPDVIFSPSDPYTGRGSDRTLSTVGTHPGTPGRPFATLRRRKGGARRGWGVTQGAARREVPKKGKAAGHRARCLEPRIP